MTKKNFSEKQIAFVLRQAESGTSVAEVIRKLGISEQTLLTWKKQFAGLGIAELRRLWTSEKESKKLKQLVPELTSDPWPTGPNKTILQSNTHDMVAGWPAE